MMPDMTQHGKAETKQWQPEADAPVIMFDRVSKTYGRINALAGVSIGISGGVTGILGMNGAGKSTFLKTMLGLIQLTSGEGKVLGFDIRTQGDLIRQKNS